MKTCLVLGGNQFVGKAVASKLISKGYKVYILNRGNHKAPLGSIQLIADRNNKKKLAEVLKGLTFDYVFDISAYTPEQTKLVIEQLAGRVKHFLHISSATVYLDSQEFPLNEESAVGNNSIWGDYGFKKYLCEQALLKSFREIDFPMTIFRPFYIYGPGNNHDRESYVFQRLITEAPIIIPGQGKNIVQFGYIDDLVNSLVRIAGEKKSFGEIYNISENRFITMNGWVDTCADIAGVNPKIVLVDAENEGFKAREWFPFRDIHLFGCTNKIQDQFGTISEHALSEGLRKTFQQLNHKNLIDEFSPLDVEKKILFKRY